MTENTYRLPVMETVKAAWSKVHGTKGSIWAIIGIFFLIEIVTGLLSSIGPKGGAMDIIFNILGSIIQLFAGASLIYLAIRRAQDFPVQYKMAKDVLTARILLCTIGFYILELIVLIPAGLLMGLGVWILNKQAEPSHTMLALGSISSIAGIILLIYLSIRMWLGYGAVVDKKLNPLDALRLSFKATAGNVWNLVGLYIISVLVTLLCAITLGIGFIWGIPWALIAYGEAYKRLATRQDIRPIG